RRVPRRPADEPRREVQGQRAARLPRAGVRRPQGRRRRRRVPRAQGHGQERVRRRRRRGEGARRAGALTMTPRALVAAGIVALAALARAQEAPEPWRVLRALEVEGLAAFDRDTIASELVLDGVTRR